MHSFGVETANNERFMFPKAHNIEHLNDFFWDDLLEVNWNRQMYRVSKYAMSRSRKFVPHLPSLSSFEIISHLLFYLFTLDIWEKNNAVKKKEVCKFVHIWLILQNSLCRCFMEPLKIQTIRIFVFGLVLNT